MQTSAGSLLSEIEAFCRRSGMAESTVGRQVVNDGKLCGRLRSGKGVTLETADKIRSFIEKNQPRQPGNGEGGGSEDTKGTLMGVKTSTRKIAAITKTGKAPAPAGEERPFRFYDNRQKYLSFVNT